MKHNKSIKQPVIWVCIFCLLLSPLSASAQLFGAFTIADEMKLGRQYEILVKTSLPTINDPEIVEYVDSLVDQLAAVVPPQPFQFTTTVLLENSLNAFAAPGGYVFVHSGLIQYLEHEADLAGVLAHEIAHVTQRHIAHSVERGQVISLATLAGMLAGILAASSSNNSDLGQAVTIAAGAAGQAASLSYSRTDESDADNTGLQYLVAAGFSPYGLNRSFTKMQENNWSRSVNYSEFLSTHPDLQNRITALNSRIQTMPADVRNRVDDDARFHRVQTLIWGRYGSVQNATQHFQAMDAGDPLTNLGLALVAERQHNVQEADRLFSRALELAPNDALYWREAGMFHFNKGDINLARQQLEQALRLKPSDYLARLYYARLLDEQGEYTAAQTNYREVLLNVPDNSEIHSYYGRSLGYSGQDFAGYLHLAYSALYANEDSRARNWLDRAKTYASGPEDQARIEQFEAVRKERREILK